MPAVFCKKARALIDNWQPTSKRAISMQWSISSFVRQAKGSWHHHHSWSTALLISGRGKLLQCLNRVDLQHAYSPHVKEVASRRACNPDQYRIAGGAADHHSHT